ncbi:MAG: hypothetical protein WBP59_10045 [Ilumatobacteraceae bacterium]
MTAVDPDCELCEAAPLTERFFDDEFCWVAECESCSVPMVVWRSHDAHPSEEVKAALHARLTAVVAVHFDGEIWIDDNLRSIPTHYHAHARRRGGFFGQGLVRRDAAPPSSTPRDPEGTT